MRSQHVRVWSIPSRLVIRVNILLVQECIWNRDSREKTWAGLTRVSSSLARSARKSDTLIFPWMILLRSCFWIFRTKPSCSGMRWESFPSHMLVLCCFFLFRAPLAHLTNRAQDLSVLSTIPVDVEALFWMWSCFAPFVARISQLGIDDALCELWKMAGCFLAHCWGRHTRLVWLTLNLCAWHWHCAFPVTNPVTRGRKLSPTLSARPLLSFDAWL